MKKGKRILALLTVLSLALALSACGGKSAPEATTGLPAKTELPAKEQAAAAADPAKTQTPAPAATPEEPAQPAAESPAGYYKMTEYISDGAPEDLDTLTSYGILYYMVLEPDGTGFLEMMGKRDTIRWEDGRIGEDGDWMPYTYANGELKIGDKTDGMTFVRLTDDEQAYYLEHGSEVSFSGEGEYAEGEGPVDDYYVEFLGAEAIEADDDGEPALRVWYRFTNGSGVVICPLMALSFDAEQDGEWMHSGFLYEDVEESENELLGVAPGCDICCTKLYQYDPAGGTIEIKVSNWYDEGVLYTLDPAALPGAPTVDLTPGYSSDDTYLDDCDDADENLEILEAEIVENWNEAPCILIHCRFTNHSDEALSFFTHYDVYALQDGIGLHQSYSPDAYTEEQDNYSAEVAPGDSVDFAVVYELRSDSSIAFAVRELFGGDSYLGCVYEFVD